MSYSRDGSQWLDSLVNYANFWPIIKPISLAYLDKNYLINVDMQKVFPFKNHLDKKIDHAIVENIKYIKYLKYIEYTRMKPPWQLPLIVYFSYFI